MKVIISWMRFDSDSCSFMIILIGRQRIVISRIVLDAAVASNNMSRSIQCGTFVRLIVQKSEIGVHSNKVIKKATVAQPATIDPTL